MKMRCVLVLFRQCLGFTQADLVRYVGRYFICMYSTGADTSQDTSKYSVCTSTHSPGQAKKVGCMLVAQDARAGRDCVDREWHARMRGCAALVGEGPMSDSRVRCACAAPAAAGRRDQPKRMYSKHHVSSSDLRRRENPRLRAFKGRGHEEAENEETWPASMLRICLHASSALCGL